MSSVSVPDDPTSSRQKVVPKSGFCTLSASDQAWLDEVYAKTIVKMKAEVDRIGTMIPYSPKDGKYHDCDMTGGIGFWTNGFWPGMLWQLYNATGEEIYKKTAEGVELRLEENLNTFLNLDHDVGFLFLPSAVADYRMTGNSDSRRRGLHAAASLAARYNLTGGFIRAWNDADLSAYFPGVTDFRGGMIIDCMMNIPLLYWASEETGDTRYAQIAESHAKTAQQWIVRPDGSCNHLVLFNSQTGEFIGAPAGQGYEKGSSWSRGQSWAVYGFALSYHHTGNKEFLDTAKRCAHYCISNMAVNGWLPLVDYRAPEDPVKYDSTAGMITACGLLEIAEYVDEHEKKLYVNAAINILRACSEKFANWNPDEDAIMGGGTFFYHDHDGTNTEVPIIYGDYYFIEAILRLKGKDLFIW
jgi:unsaturated chondroitin disaccharide hydrolase